jgi:hypothetical protein
MKEIDTSELIRYDTGLYKGKINWENNIGKKLKFIYNEISGEIDIIDYVKGNPQGTITVKYKENILNMKTSMLTKCRIGNLIKYYNYDYIYNIGDTLKTEYNSNIKILEQIKLYNTRCYERGYKVKCLDCNYIYDIREVHITSCPMCSDRVSYPEKFVINLLQQLKVDFEIQKMFEWSGLKRYDLYVPSLDAIIEVNGLIHYKPTMLASTYRNGKKINKYEELENRIKNDKEKYEMANKNKIKHCIIIDAKNSNPDYIKQSVLKTELAEFFDLSNIDWFKCHEFACTSLVKQASYMWNDNMSIEKIAYELNLSNCTISNYLRTGNDLGYCIYDKHINMSNNHNSQVQYKPVICINTGEIFKSQSEATKTYNIYKTGISDCCNGRISSAGKHPITGDPLKWKFYIKEQ